MLRVEHDGINVEIRFYHKICKPHEVESITGVCVDDDRRCSLAELHLNGVWSNRGASVCHPSDNFCRAIGRKRALKDAIFALSKDVRSKIWDAYKAQCKGFENYTQENDETLPG